MDDIVVPLIILGTSLGVYLCGRRAGLSHASFRAAVGQFLEFLGTLIIWVTLNGLILVFVVLALRELGGRFISFYIVGDPLIVAFSAIQALLLQLWRQGNDVR